MHSVGIRCWFLAACAMAILTVGCGQEGAALYPTAPTGALGSTAVGADVASDVAATALTGDAFMTLGSGNGHGKDRDKDKDKDKDKGKGGDDSEESNENSDDSDDDGEDGNGIPGRGHRGMLSGFVTAVDGDSLVVRGITVKVEPTTLIRHGHRVLTIADIQVGDHVQARGAMDGTTLVATEIKVEDTGHANRNHQRLDDI